MSCARLYRNGTVTRVEGTRARVAFDAFAGCAVCKGGCGMAQVAQLLGTRRPAELGVAIAAGRRIAVGDRVAVGIDAGRLLQLVLLTFTLPLAGLVGGATVAPALVAGPGDAVAAGGALLGGLLAAIPALALRRRRPTTAWLNARIDRTA